jgi:hypothetical protein
MIKKQNFIGTTLMSSFSNSFVISLDIFWQQIKTDSDYEYLYLHQLTQMGIIASLIAFPPEEQIRSKACG